ncbi:RNase H family protein [Actinopolymorpha sp. B17G11]|uniref:RNase H family protein n=1 Tax=Actinopolymorpha sp. B17G11 TaxID=3160861 RepID=UPI0032E4508F
MHIAGSCDPDPGCGGWACVVLNPGRGTRVERSGAEWETTRNRMALRALFEGVAALSGEQMVDLVCDSDHVLTGLKNKVWKAREPVEDLEHWQRLVWNGDGPSPVENFDLWRRLEELRAGRVGIMPAFQRIANRSKPDRERCRQLAVAARGALAGSA